MFSFCTGGSLNKQKLVQHHDHGNQCRGRDENVPRAGVEPASLTFQASVLPLHHIGSLMSPLYPWPPVYVALYLIGQFRLLQYFIHEGNHGLLAHSIIPVHYTCLP